MNPKVARAVELGKTPAGIGAARSAAKKALPGFPHNGCAAFLSALLREAGLTDLVETLGAQALADTLAARGWYRVPLAKPQAGDVGVTRDEGGNPGADHIYLVLEVMIPDLDALRIVDNQATQPHIRHASGKGGKTATAYFLRAPEQ
jgi:hypothetical protein